MSFVFIRRYGLTTLLILILGSCESHVKKGQPKDDTYTVSAGDTTIGVQAIIDRSNAMLTNNKMDDATKFVSVNIHRFHGSDKAMLLNARGDTYFLKDDFDNAINDYLGAVEIDSANTTYLINVAKTYENMESLANAIFFANKILELKDISDSDKVIARELILRSDRTRTGH